MSEHTDWWYEVCRKAGVCPSCQQEKEMQDPNTDFSAAQPSAWSHTCGREPKR